jgi:hypothetical protein
MFQIRPQADTGSATLGFNAVWHRALKSQRLGPRRRLIKHLRADTRHCATNKSAWIDLHRLLKFAWLKLLESEMRLQNAAAQMSDQTKCIDLPPTAPRLATCWLPCNILHWLTDPLLQNNPLGITG